MWFSIRRCGKDTRVLTVDSEADLIGHVSDMTDGIRQVMILLHEVKRADGQQLKTETRVTVIVEPLQHLYTQTETHTHTHTHSNDVNDRHVHVQMRVLTYHTQTLTHTHRETHRHRHTHLS